MSDDSDVESFLTGEQHMRQTDILHEKVPVTAVKLASWPGIEIFPRVVDHAS